MSQADTSSAATGSAKPPMQPPPIFITPGRGAAAAAAVAFGLYLITISPTFGFIDEGELAAVASTLGIAHPTGYPTFTLLGYLFTALLPVRDIVALNVMAALLVASSVGVMTLLFAHILGRLGTTTPPPSATAVNGGHTGRKQHIPASPPAGSKPVQVAIGGCAALLTGFTATWWEQATGVEVYSLHALLLPLLGLLFLRYMDQEEEKERSMALERPQTWSVGYTGRGLAFSVVLGIAFTNHLTTIHLAPAFLAYYFWSLGFGGWRNDRPTSGHRSPARGAAARSLVRLLYLAPGFLLGLLPYLYLPIRASMQPRFAWGNPHTLENFVRHVTGQVFQVYMFESSTAFQNRTSLFLGNLPGEFAYVGLILAVVGAVLMARRNARLFAWTALIIAACILHAGNYDIMEIAPYYMAAVLALGIWCAAGYQWVYEKIGTLPALSVAALIAVGGCALNYGPSNERPNRLVEDMTINMLRTLPHNAIIFSSQWDFWVAGSYYMQGVEKMRQDVLVIDQELLRRTWYLDELQANYPEFMERVAPEVERFRREVRPFDQGEPFDPNVIQSAYIGMIDAIIDRNIALRPILMTSEVDRAMGARYGRVPSYLAYRLTSDTAYRSQEFPDYTFSFWPGRMDYYTAKIYEMYALSLAQRMAYEGRYGYDSLAACYRDYALTFDPGWNPALVRPLPLNSDQEVLKTIQVFEGLRRLRSEWGR